MSNTVATKSADRTTASRIRISALATVLLPFALGYFMSYFFRTVNALLAGRFTADFGLTAAELGALTSTYFFAAAVAQLPVGFALDRFGPRRMQILALAVASFGAAAFALADNFLFLCASRALIGLGVASALVSGIKIIALRFPAERAGLLNGILIAAGAAGAIAASAPTQWLLTLATWRDLYLAFAVATGAIWFAHVAVVPRDLPASTGNLASQGFGTVLRDPRFWRFAPMASLVIGTAWAYQGLWMAVWFADAARLDEPAVVQLLLVMAVSFCAGAFGYGILLDVLRRFGVGPAPVMAAVALIVVVVEVLLALQIAIPPFFPAVLMGLVSASTVLSFTTLRSLYDTALVGRANGLLNTMNFATAFTVQSGFGVIVAQGGKDATGQFSAQAFAPALLTFAVVKLLALLWFLAKPGASVSPAPAGRGWRIAGVLASLPLLVVCVTRLGFPERTEFASLFMTHTAVAAPTSTQIDNMIETVRRIERELHAALAREATLTVAIKDQGREFASVNHQLARMIEKVSGLEQAIGSRPPAQAVSAPPTTAIMSPAAIAPPVPAACPADQLDGQAAVVIPFDLDRATLSNGDMRRIKPLLDLLGTCPNARLLVEGFTDNRGTSTINAELSWRRAERVAAFIVTRGISPDLIVAKGRGDADPIGPNDTRAARARNRRVEVSLIDAR